MPKCSSVTDLSNVGALTYSKEGLLICEVADIGIKLLAGIWAHDAVGEALHSSVDTCSALLARLVD